MGNRALRGSDELLGMYKAMDMLRKDREKALQERRHGAPRVFPSLSQFSTVYCAVSRALGRGASPEASGDFPPLLPLPSPAQPHREVSEKLLGSRPHS